MAYGPRLEALFRRIKETKEHRPPQTPPIFVRAPRSPAPAVEGLPGARDPKHRIRDLFRPTSGTPGCTGGT